MSESHRRRLDSILGESFVAALASLEPAELRRRLAMARTEEEDLSYVRRILHGRLDILSAELAARTGGRGTVRGLDALRDALANGGSGNGRGARSRVLPRAASTGGRRRAQQVVSETDLARLPDLDADQIQAIIERGEVVEREVSETRRALHEVIEVLEVELAARYKAGLAPPV